MPRVISTHDPIGKMVDYFAGTPTDGYLLCQGAASAIGPAGGTTGSGVTGIARANADVQDLYNLLWPQASVLGIFTSTGVATTAGASAAADWAAGKQLALPDTRRRTTIGSGGTQVSGPATTLGAMGGEESHTLSTGEMPVHNHSASDSGHRHAWDAGSGTGANNYVGIGGSGQAVSSPNPAGLNAPYNVQTGYAAISIGNAGSGGAHNNMQPSLVVTKMIRY